ncbi:WecB/TagA/CpsF family glycosyltransferase [Bacillus sp. AGMB 02131]|uniref:N-acetylglucosaminyldiphosphoundecaprenol N-acetyl-beta-D-mannosaminyltransferase n=1 Tax=Peribacillus faecalis TaxID=2772559 RepID=A0A927CVY7_9BACI|nr:WecB/TagA/CpsF family glycosyltransferase [Peribacillus faecalis]MBD3108526.1 WecB/TagA/CpsF family glycosyltransferase [Peribacillus faecalis]
MKKTTVNILGVDFINEHFNGMIEIVSGKIAEEQKTFIVTANPEIVMHAYKDKEYHNIINKADYIVPDGIGIILASKIIKNPLEERIAGYDLTISLLEKANLQKWSIYVLGGQEEVNKLAVKNIIEKYPNLKIAGRHHGFFELNDPEIVNDIKNTRPDIILVALGFPRQEEWIGKHYDEFTKGIFMGVGGSIDVLAGTVKRAPVIWQKLKVEWLYRLLKQPSRWKRMLALPDFVIKVMKLPKK